MNFKREPQKAGNILKGLLRKNPVLRGGINSTMATALREVLSAYPGTAEEHTSLISLARGVVTVGVDSSVLRHEMQCFHAQEILVELKQKVPQANLRKINFVVASPQSGLELEQ